MGFPLLLQRVLRSDTGCCPHIPRSTSSPPTRVPWHSPDHCLHPPGAASHLHQGTANWEPITAPTFPGGSDSKESICNAEDLGSTWVGNIPWRRAWQPTSIFLPGESHEQRSLAGYIQSIGSQRVGHDWRDSARTHAYHWGGQGETDYLQGCWWKYKILPQTWRGLGNK